MECEYENENRSCNKEARYLLQYKVDWRLLEMDSNHDCAADMEIEVCEEHVKDIDFLFNPNYGLPERIIEMDKGKECSDLVKKIEMLYKRKNAK